MSTTDHTNNSDLQSCQEEAKNYARILTKAEEYNESLKNQLDYERELHNKVMDEKEEDWAEIHDELENKCEESFNELSEEVEECNKKYERDFAKFKTEAARADQLIKTLQHTVDETQQDNDALTEKIETMQNEIASQIGRLENDLNFYKNEVSLGEEARDMVKKLQGDVSTLKRKTKEQQTQMGMLRSEAKDSAERHTQELNDMLLEHKSALLDLQANRDSAVKQAKVYKDMNTRTSESDQPQEYRDWAQMFAQF